MATVPWNFSCLQILKRVRHENNILFTVALTWPCTVMLKSKTSPKSPTELKSDISASPLKTDCSNYWTEDTVFLIHTVRYCSPPITELELVWRHPSLDLMAAVLRILHSHKSWCLVRSWKESYKPVWSTIIRDRYCAQSQNLWLHTVAEEDVAIFITRTELTVWKRTLRRRRRDCHAFR